MPDAENQPRKRALVVDDSAYMRATLKQILDRAGYETVGEADDGAPVADLYRQLRPDLVTLDMVMLKVDGLTALREVMALDPQARVVMVTAMGQEDIIRQAMSLGARAYFLKPFKTSEVVEALKKLA
ncbi:MAG: response regulator [Euryarchaeota archaeon]|nr:response regulator [Euryarchaeota archaeon]